MFRIFMRMISNPFKGSERIQRTQGSQSIANVIDAFFDMMLQTTSSFAPKEKSIGKNTELPVTSNSLNRSDLIMVKSDMIFEISGNAFNFPSQGITNNISIGIKFEMIGNKDVNILGSLVSHLPTAITMRYSTIELWILVLKP